DRGSIRVFDPFPGGSTMPLYEYACRSCDAHFEVKRSFSDPPLTVHEGCGGELRKVLQPVGIVFKGSGWYITDSRKTTEGKSESKGETRSESKSEAKSESSVSKSKTKAA